MERGGLRGPSPQYGSVPTEPLSIESARERGIAAMAGRGELALSIPTGSHSLRGFAAKTLASLRRRISDSEGGGASINATEEGGDARNLARLAARIARANAALEVQVDDAERYLALKDEDGPHAGFDAGSFAVMPEEIRLRLLKRAIDRIGHEGPAELGKVETLLAALDGALAKREPKLKQTLAGAVVSLAGGRITIAPAPPRRVRSR